MREQINEQIEQAKKVKLKHGYTTNAVICKTWYSPRKFSIGFHFQGGVDVGYVGKHADGSRFEVLALA